MNAYLEHTKKRNVKQFNMLIALSKYDQSSLSIPNSFEDNYPSFAGLLFNDAKKISFEKILSIKAKSLEQLYSKKCDYKKIFQTSIWQTINNQLKWFALEQEISDVVNSDKAYIINIRLNKIYKSINTENTIVLSSVYKKFTPWNLDGDKNRLYKYGWEFSAEGMPMLIDVFHFIFQTQFALSKEKTSGIKKNLHDALQNQSVKEIIDKYGIDIALHYKLYLLFSISHYLRICINQNILYAKKERILNIWNDALEEFE